MVIANQAPNFSAGANLMLLLMTAQEGEWDDIHLAVRQFQRVNMAIKYAPRPVVSAPQGMALGGGCEINLHAARIHATAEAYIGLVEVGVGLIPGGGGTKEMLIRANEHAAGGDSLDLMHALRPIFENIAMAKVSTSAEEARSLGYLRPSDLIAMNRDRQIADAKQTALAMVRAGYHPPAPAEIRVLGEEFLARGEARDAHDGSRRIRHGVRRRGRAQARLHPRGRRRSPRRRASPSSTSSISNARRSSACAASARRRSASPTR